MHPPHTHSSSLGHRSSPAPHTDVALEAHLCRAEHTRAVLLRAALLLISTLICAASLSFMQGLDGPGHASDVALAPRAKAPPLWAVFVDSLSYELATDAALMPHLAGLSRAGAAFSVEPCRDRLTNVCLRAAFTGHDEAPPLALLDNFAHRRREQGHLFERLAERGGRAVLVGAHDLLPYASSDTTALPFDENERGDVGDEPEQLGALLSRVPPGADAVVVGLSAIDRAAHASGPSSPAYDAACRSTDELIARVLASAPAGAHVAVFGDHGHDRQGRHLPGGGDRTFALFAGPAFVAGAIGSLALTDERAIAGLLLQVPSPQSYRGPEMCTFMHTSWLDAHVDGDPSRVGAPPPPPPAAAPRLVALVLATLGAALSALLALSALQLRPALAISGVAASGAVLAGLGYEQVRALVHGDDPVRWASLLLVFGAGAALGHVAARRSSSCNKMHTSAAVMVLFTLLSLYPTAYFYGAARATVFAAMLAVGALGIGARTRPLAGLVALSALALFYDVRGVGPTGQTTHYVLRASLLTTAPWAALAGAKAALLLLAGPLTSRRDLALAACALAALLATQLANAHGPPLLGAAVVSCVFMHRSPLPLTRLALSVAALSGFFGDLSHAVAPLEALVAGSVGALTLLAAPSRPLGAAVALVVAAYLSLWPSLGMRVAGLDFSFAFAFVPSSRIDALWWLIALLALAKVAWPLVCLVDAAFVAGATDEAIDAWRVLFTAKPALIAALLAGHVLAHPATSTLAQHGLSELAVALASSLLLWAVTWRVRPSRLPRALA